MMWSKFNYTRITKPLLRAAYGRFSNRVQADSFPRQEFQRIFGYGVVILFTVSTIVCFPTEAAPPDTTAAKKEILSLIEAEDERRGDGTSIGPTLVRLAWHASGFIVNS